MNSIEHIVACVAEEGNEVGQACMKILRFALQGNYPDGTSNIEALVRELNDLQGAVELLQDYGVELPGLGNRVAVEAKKKKILDHMKLARERGALD